jgi:hypothetical protein
MGKVSARNENLVQLNEDVAGENLLEDTIYSEDGGEPETPIRFDETTQQTNQMPLDQWNSITTGLGMTPFTKDYRNYYKARLAFASDRYDNALVFILAHLT